MRDVPSIVLATVLLCWTAGQGRGAEPTELPLALSVRGDQFRGRLTRIDEQWHFTFDAGEKRHVVTADDLVHWGEFHERDVGPLVVLADGGILVADQKVRVAADRVTIRSRRLWTETAIPQELVQGILYQPSPVPLERDRQLNAILSAIGESDQVVLANGDRLAGLVRASDDAQLENQDQYEARQIVVETAEQSIAVPIDRVVSLVFNPALVRRPKPTATQSLVGFRDGSWLIVDQFIPRPDRLRLVLSGGIVVESYSDLDAGGIWDEVVMVRPRSSRVTYLSELDAISFKKVAFLENTLDFQRDRNVRGGYLRAGGVRFDKGIGMHSTSRLAYRLGGAYREFAAALAVDDLAGHRGSVRFRVYLADDAGKWTLGHESDIIRGGQPPVPISIDVSNAIAIALIVEFADYGDQLDYANWLNARLVR